MAAATISSKGQAYVQPRAGWQVMLAGKDLTNKLAPRLLSLRLTEKRGEEADALEIVVHDHDGKLALPPEGAVLTVRIGWLRGTGITPGLVDKGAFTVDEVSWDGPPDRVTITARSADFKGSFRTRRTRAWTGRTLADIVGQIAADHGLAPRCHADLAGTTVTAAEQHNKSDMQFLRDLGRRYDAVATVKGGCLILAPINATTTATGKPIGALVIDRRRTSRAAYRRSAREQGQDGAEAQWHDRGAAARKTAGAGGKNRKRLKRVYASEADASAAASAETNRLKRAAASLDLTLALGDALIAPGMRATTSGFKSEIDREKWLIGEAEHTMDGNGGLKTRAKMEVAG